MVQTYAILHASHLDKAREFPYISIKKKQEIIGKVIKNLSLFFLKHMEEDKPSDGILLI
jgi:hypothetical protein